MKFDVPHIAFIILCLTEIGFKIGAHGQPRDEHHWGEGLFSAAILLGLTWWGGFYG